MLMSQQAGHEYHVDYNESEPNNARGISEKRCSMCFFRYIIFQKSVTALSLGRGHC